MNPEQETITLPEVGNLLALAAARDQRTTGTADNIAWWQDLNAARVTFADAEVALSLYYATVWPRQRPEHRFRATAPALIEIVRGIREKRFEAANFVYEPVPDETGAQFAARLQAQQRAVGDGHVPAYSTAELRPRPVAALVAGIAEAKTLPPEIADVLAPRRTGPRSVRCPVCGVEPGKHCVNGGGRTMGRPHPTRENAHAVATVACPECRAQPDEACRQLGEPYPGGAHPGRVKSAADATRIRNDQECS